MFGEGKNTQYHIFVRFPLCSLHFAMRAICRLYSISHAMRIMTGHSLRYIVTTRNATWFILYDIYLTWEA